MEMLGSNRTSPLAWAVSLGLLALAHGWQNHASSKTVDDQHGPWKLTAVAGRNATLKCPASNVNNHRVAWIRNESRTILSLHGELVTQSNRYAIEKRELGSFDLRITNVKESDAGTYICQVNSDPMKNLVIFLYVVKSPNIRPADNLSDQVKVLEGDSVTLECLAEGIPKPNITWKKAHQRDRADDIIIDPSYPGMMHLRNVGSEDAGKYMCIASNGYPPPVSHTFQLLVLYKPRLKMTVKKLTSLLHEIKCAVISYPPLLNVTIRSRDNERIPHVVNSDDSLKKKGFETVIAAEVPVVGKKRFRCFAKNSVGNSVKSVTVRGHKGTFDADITLATVAFSRAATSRLNVTTFHDPGTTEATYFVDDAASPHVISTPRSHAVTHPSCDKFLGLSFGVLLLQILDAHCAHE